MTTNTDPLTITAYHEAAHSVVQYRVAGFADRITIIPNEQAGTLGGAQDECSDSFNPTHITARILSLYAGGHAQRRCDPVTGSDGCGADDEEAARWLVEWGWDAHEPGFREEARILVDRHWAEITAVAAELLRTSTLDSTEVELIADATAGLADFIFGSLDADLAHYRAFRDQARSL